MNTTKTGAIVCKKTIPGSHLLEYEALLFITDVPHNITDEELKKSLASTLSEYNANKECVEIIVRADINSTSNEVWEQFKGLNDDKDKAKIVSYQKAITSNS